MPQADSFTLFDYAKGIINPPLKIRLWKGVFTPGVTTVPGDFPQADYIGYSEKDWSHSVPPTYDVPSKTADIFCGHMIFTRQSNVGPHQSIGGFYVVAVFPDNSEALVGYKEFKQPQVMNENGNTFMFNVHIGSQTFVLET